MARRSRRLSANVEGDFYVDDSCIDCGACRWIAPDSFDADGDFSHVHSQPATEAQTEAALRALVSCPTSSIGTESKRDVSAAVESFPYPIAEDGVYHCGFHSENSFGAASYLVTRDGGNVLVDSPRFTQPLVRRIEELGGISLMFLTHCDDVADHQRFRDHFGCERVIHEDDVRRGTRGVEHRVGGLEPRSLAEDLLVIPTPGHTKGSACLLVRDRILFTGDHLAWSRARNTLHAFNGACWYDWDVQIESMERLAGFRFEHVLPGHSAPCSLDPEAMHAHLERCIAWMRTVSA